MISPRRVVQALALPMVAMAMVVTVAACGGGSSDAASGGGAKVTIPDSKFTNETGHRTVAIETHDNEFDPPYMMVSTGTKVTWTNDGRNTHNIVPTNSGAFKKATGDDFTPGASWSVTFAAAGDYPYYCSIHGTPKNGQNGVVRVKAAS